MNKLMIKRGLIALVAGSALLGGVAMANPHHEGGHEGRPMMDNMRHMFRGLDLTDEQKTQFRELMKAHKDERKAQREGKDDAARTAHHEKMKALMSAATFDEAAAKALIAERQAKGEARALEAMKLQHQMYQLLTPEQKAKFQARFDERKADREERRKERQEAF
ncbi:MULTISPECIES: Spy/CpxP family protein refolding chaperone [Shewanella]|uniref:Spy/CpxP family protein refolding chaperone n=1 Tax=Shewanella TaxID=22 RepID=UPI001C659022|nr:MULTISPECIES: Spy/CpxP family protein refolding chaperone [Shewanella]QYJ75185.1 Spy/CpxP family protein refolding chaperone [Shewanella sp. FJAT-52076]QYK05056.1 Spy/CpxP family protein refolding chaperone [Shewanella zhangzhouensis]